MKNNKFKYKLTHSWFFKSGVVLTILCLSTFFLSKQAISTWGFWAHKRINRLAVFTLPPELIGFYKTHIEYITEHAVDPDKRRYAVVGEEHNHYIDIDHYGEYPYDNMPRKWEDAVAKYSEDTLRAYGIVPWKIEEMLGKLTYAMQRGNLKRILSYSADIGHYIGDSHVPLHTSKNYNGQLTNQKGIHGFWESRIPELYGDDFDYWVGKAKYMENPRDHIWTVILESAAAVDSVLGFERNLNATYPTDQKYCHEQRGATLTKTYCEGYSKEYNEMLNGMVERRMRQAIHTIGSFWLTAWVNAGQPDLSSLGSLELSQKEEEKQKELEQKFDEKAIVTKRDHRE